MFRRTEGSKGRRKIRRITERRDPTSYQFDSARIAVEVDSMGMRMDHQSPDNLYLLGILTMTKGPDRRARELLTGRPLLPATHKAPARGLASSEQSSRTILLPRQRADPALVPVSSRLISLCRFFRAPSLVLTAHSLSIIFCFFFLSSSSTSLLLLAVMIVRCFYGQKPRPAPYTINCQFWIVLNFYTCAWYFTFDAEISFNL